VLWFPTWGIPNDDEDMMFVVEPKLFFTNTIVSLKKSIALFINRYYNRFGKVTSDGLVYKSLLNVKNQHGESMVKYTQKLV